jgi:hypothetical protein
VFSESDMAASLKKPLRRSCLNNSLVAALKQVFHELTDEDHDCGSHTPWATLHKFPFPSRNTANAGHSAENHYSQPDEADQTAEVENLRQRAKLSPFGHHGYTSFPKHLELISTLLVRCQQRYHMLQGIVTPAKAGVQCF